MPNEDAPTDEIPVVEIYEPVEPVAEHVEDPDALRGGFGGRNMGPVTIGLLTFAAVIAAVLVGVLTTYLVDFVSGENVVDRPSAAPTTTTRDPGMPVVIGPLNMEVLDDSSVQFTPEDGSTFTLEQVLIDASGTANYTLYGVPAEQETAHPPVIAEGKLRGGQISADVETNEPLLRVVLKVDGETDVKNVSLVGHEVVH